MRSLKRAVCAAAVFAAIAVPASARVVCNAEGDCWHTDKVYHYKPDVKVVVHPDSWYFRQTWDKDRRYHEHHDDRGYYRNGQWVPF
ncbi:MAG: hypothetical protein P4L57_03465 [Rhizomicrobium sp.]|nr:hypothetical protein [Rhizomicrobium sp.]